MADPERDKPSALDYHRPPPKPAVSLRRRIIAALLLGIALALTALGISSGNSAVAMNFGTLAFAIALVAIFLRYGNAQH